MGFNLRGLFACPVQSAGHLHLEEELGAVTSGQRGRGKMTNLQSIFENVHKTARTSRF